MRVGASLDMGWLADLDGVRRAAITFDEAGVDFLTTSGHLLTAREGRYPGFPPATYSLPYRDPFVLFAHLAAVTNRLRFRTAILILPLFPTVLVAKQAADLSLLSGGRFELGVGISWQEAEYQAMGQPMRRRGSKLEEQIAVLHALWTQPLVTFSGRHHELDEIGIGQLPASPIPIWLGCGTKPELLGRVARIADGWMPGGGLASPEAAAALQELATSGGRAGEVGVCGRVMAGGSVEEMLDRARGQVAYGATELVVGAPPGSSIADGVEAIAQARRHLEAL
ncbi:MAG TPA: TIGR03619 family F420-dependent LLM class oxidoreductase [Acidimicrobiales bacterium]